MVFHMNLITERAASAYADMIWVRTDDGAVDIVVEPSSALDDAAPWTAGTSEAAT